MVESRWPRRLGPVLAAVGAVVVAAATAGDPGAWLPPPCAGPPGPGPGGIGAWYRLDPIITDGIRTGQRLSVGRGDGDAGTHVDLDPESFASGPSGGAVLAGTDDGRTSRLSLLDLGAGCAWDVGRSGDVVRHATLAPDGRSIVEFRVRPTDALGPRGVVETAGRPRPEPDPRPDRCRRPLRADLAHASSAGARTAARSSSSRAARSPAGSASSTWRPPRWPSSPTRRSARSSASPTAGSSHAAHAWACPARWSRSTGAAARR